VEGNGAVLRNEIPKLASYEGIFPEKNLSRLCLSLARSACDQWEAVLDTDVWDGHTRDLEEDQGECEGPAAPAAAT
jgi:hypothetical protein